MRRFIISASVALTLVSAPAFAQGAPASQLDFLGGDWIIQDSSGARVGQSHVVVQAAGAMLYEERRVGSDPAQPLWFEHSERNNGWSQLFLGPAGRTREFIALAPPGTWPIVMGANVVLRDGTPVRFRLTMSRASDDETRRLLEMSRDAGATWDTVFDYIYRRTPAG